MDDRWEPRDATRLDFAEREVALRADLGDRDEEDCIWTPLRFVMRGPRAPRPARVVGAAEQGPMPHPPAVLLLPARVIRAVGDVAVGAGEQHVAVARRQ